MEAVAVAAIAVLGTLLGAAVTSWAQARQASTARKWEVANRGFEIAKMLRTEREAVYAEWVRQFDLLRGELPSKPRTATEEQRQEVLRLAKSLSDAGVRVQLIGSDEVNDTVRNAMEAILLLTRDAFKRQDPELYAASKRETYKVREDALSALRRDLDLTEER